MVCRLVGAKPSSDAYTHQGIIWTNPGILECYTNGSLSSTRKDSITWAISVLRDDKQWKYMFYMSKNKFCMASEIVWWWTIHLHLYWIVSSLKWTFGYDYVIDIGIFFKKGTSIKPLLCSFIKSCVSFSIIPFFAIPCTLQSIQTTHKIKQDLIFKLQIRLTISVLINEFLSSRELRLSSLTEACYGSNSCINWIQYHTTRGFTLPCA